MMSRIVYDILKPNFIFREGDLAKGRLTLFLDLGGGLEQS